MISQQGLILVSVETFGQHESNVSGYRAKLLWLRNNFLRITEPTQQNGLLLHLALIIFLFKHILSNIDILYCRCVCMYINMCSIPVNERYIRYVGICDLTTSFRICLHATINSWINMCTIPENERYIPYVGICNLTTSFRIWLHATIHE